MQRVCKVGYPPPPCPRTALRKNRPLVPRSISRTAFFYHSIGFFMILVDAGQLFRCARQHFMCVATGPPIRGDPISQSQVHIPLKPLPPARPLPRSNQPLTRKQTKATVLGPGAQSETVQIEYKRNERLVKHPAALIANLSHPILSHVGQRPGAQFEVSAEPMSQD